MPVTKLMAPSAIIRIRKPVGPSDRCGVSTARNAPGSACVWCHFPFMSAILPMLPARAKPRCPKPSDRDPRRAMRQARAQPQAPAASPERVEEIFRALCRRQPGAQGRAGVREPLYPAGRRGAVGAGDRRRRQQGDARPVQGGRYARRRCWRSAWTRCRSASRPSASIRNKAKNVIALSRAAAWPSTAARCRTSARRWRRCRASAARPPMWCSTSPSASRRWPSTRTCSALRTGSISPTAKRRWRWSWAC